MTDDKILGLLEPIMHAIAATQAFFAHALCNFAEQPGVDLQGLTYMRKQYSSGDPAHVAMPGVHRVLSLLRRWILGTHQGSVVPAHLQSYLEEFTFRFNRRTSRSRGLVFRRLIEQAVTTGPVTEADVTFGYDWDGGQVSRS